MFKKIFIYNTDSLYIQFIRYGFVGIIAFSIDFGFLFLFTKYLHIYYLISATLSFLIALVVNYLLSTKWVFKKRTGTSVNNELIIFVVIAVIGLLINDLIMWFLTDIINLFYLISKIVASLIVLFWNFYGRRNLFYKFPSKK